MSLFRCYLCKSLIYFLPLALLFCILSPLWANEIKTIRVVMDDNYPPYVFRDRSYQLQGIVVDRWRLFEEKTGIKVILLGTDWGLAQDYFKETKADVIDTIFKTPAREKIYSFSKPYATIEVPVFFHKNIQGISDVDELVGFTIGVKKGDASIEILKQKGVHNLSEFDNYEEIIKAAIDKKIHVFTIDKPPALYYMHKYDVIDEFRVSIKLYEGQLHYAVHKGNEHILELINRGFEKISKEELDKINDKWLGSSISNIINFEQIKYGLIIVLAVVFILIMWNYSLRRLVDKKTKDLNEAIDSLKESQRGLQLMKFAVDKSYDMVIRINREGKIEYANKTTSERLGYTRDELTNMDLYDLDISLNTEKMQEIIDKLDYTGRCIYETTLKSKNNENIPVEVNLSVSTYNNVNYIHAFIRDIRERRKLEDEIIKREKLESLGLLAGGIAHDFNNLLTVIVGNLSLIEMKLDGRHDLKKLVDSASKASERAKELTGKLLTFSKGGVPIRKTESLREVINETVSFAFSGSNVKCEVLIDDDLDNADIDVTQIHQVLHNLIINADHAMPEGGVITIKASNTYLDDTRIFNIKKGRYVKIMVSDTGKGIPKENLKRIFDPYFTTKAHGSGLGLATAYSVIKKHDGHIEVESELNKGTTFTIYLPSSTRAVKGDTERGLQPVKIEKGGNVLIMDDDIAVTELLTSILDELGYQTTICHRGEDAINLYKKALQDNFRYNVVIMDLTVRGGMGGKDTVREILNLDQNAYCVVISGYSKDPVMSNYKDYGFKAAIKKPFTINEVSTILRTNE